MKKFIILTLLLLNFSILTESAKKNQSDKYQKFC